MNGLVRFDSGAGGPWPVGLDLLQFEEAVAWFRSRVPMTKDEWQKLDESARKRAFTVAGVAQLDLVAEVSKSIDSALADGLDFNAWKGAIGEKLKTAWAGSVKDPAWRLETIFRTNIQHAYGEGRRRQLSHPSAVATHPVWRFDAILDGRETPICQKCDGTVLPATHAWWTTHQVPLHFNCRSAIVPLTEEDAKDEGLTSSPPEANADEGFGKPDEEWAPTAADYPAKLWLEYLYKLPPPMLPPAPTPAENILHEKVGEAEGSNPGGVYVGKDGIKRYVKFYKDAAQAHGEHLANQIYRDLGLAAPESTVFDHEGNAVYASVIVEGAKPLGKAGLTKERAKAIMEGFVADVFTANWDAVGLSHDNVLVLADGSLMRVDNGGSFLMRAKAGRKSDDALRGITEWDKLRSPSVNPAYAKVSQLAGMAGDRGFKAVAARGIKAVLALKKEAGSWSAYVERTAPGMPTSDKQTVVEMLEARSDLLAQKLKELTKRKPRASTMVPGAVVFDFESAAGKKILAKLHDLQSGHKRREFYADLFAKAGLSPAELSATQGDIDEWTGEYRLGSKHAQLYGAFAKLKGAKSVHSSSKEVEERLGRLLATRGRRWELFLEAVGEPPIAPTHLRSYRGVHGRDRVVEIARAWADESTDTATLVSHELASWAVVRSATDSFGGERAHGVVYRWDAPIENTTHDQVTDDASFISVFFTEHEVVAGPGHEQGLTVPKSDAVVTFDGKKYTYADREKLFTRLRAQGLL